MYYNLNMEWPIAAFFFFFFKSENNWNSSKNAFRALVWKKCSIFFS